MPRKEHLAQVEVGLAEAQVAMLPGRPQESIERLQASQALVEVLKASLVEDAADLPQAAALLERSIAHVPTYAVQGKLLRSARTKRR